MRSLRASAMALIQLAQDVLGDDQALDLTGPLVDGGHPHVPPVSLDRELTGVTITAQDLESTIAGLEGALAGHQLGLGGEPRKGAPPVLAPGCLQHQQPPGVAADGRVGEHLLDGLEVAERLPELPASARV